MPDKVTSFVTVNQNEILSSIRSKRILMLREQNNNLDGHVKLNLVLSSFPGTGPMSVTSARL